MRCLTQLFLVGLASATLNLNQLRPALPKRALPAEESVPPTLRRQAAPRFLTPETQSEQNYVQHLVNIQR